MIGSNVAHNTKQEDNNKLGTVLFVDGVMNDVVKSKINDLSKEFQVSLVIPRHEFGISLKTIDETISDKTYQLKSILNTIQELEVRKSALENELKLKKANVDEAKTHVEQAKQAIKDHLRKLQQSESFCREYDEKQEKLKLERSVKLKEKADLRASRPEPAVNIMKEKANVLQRLQDCTTSTQMVHFKEVGNETAEYDEMVENRNYIDSAHKVGLELQARFFESRRVLDSAMASEQANQALLNLVVSELLLHQSIRKELLEDVKTLRKEHKIAKKKVGNAESLEGAIRAFSNDTGIGILEIESYSELCLQQKQGNYIIFADQETTENITPTLSKSYFTTSISSKVPSFQQSLSSSFIRDLPVFEEDLATSNNKKFEAKETANDNNSFIETCRNNSFAIGNVIGNDLIRSFSWYLSFLYRGVVKEVSLLNGEYTQVALFKKGSPEKSGSYFCISKYNEGKAVEDKINCFEIGDCIAIKLDPQNQKALQKWYDTFGPSTYLKSWYSEFQLSI